jgi:predicted nucleic acid-binding protein
MKGNHKAIALTSDADLLDLKTHEGLRIIPPQEFVTLLNDTML